MLKHNQLKPIQTEEQQPLSKENLTKHNNVAQEPDFDDGGQPINGQKP